MGGEDEGGKGKDEQWGGVGSHFPVIHGPFHACFHLSYPSPISLSVLRPPKVAARVDIVRHVAPPVAKVNLAHRTWSLALSLLSSPLIALLGTSVTGTVADSITANTDTIMVTVMVTTKRSWTGLIYAGGPSGGR